MANGSRDDTLSTVITRDPSTPRLRRGCGAGPPKLQRRRQAGDPVRRDFSVQQRLSLEYWVARSRLRQGFAGPQMRSAAEALAKAASRAMTGEGSFGGWGRLIRPASHALG